MRKILFAVCGLILSLSVLPMPAAGEPVAPAPKRLVAVQTRVAPVIDGKLDDACWQGAPSVSDFSVFSNPNVMHPEPTKGWVCYDQDYLYIALECKVKEMDKFKKRMAAAAGKFDYALGGVVEVFLDTNHNRKTFQQYLLHANGSTMITLFPGDELKVLNEDYLKCVASVKEDGYVVEAAFPLAMLHLGPNTSKIWGFNLNRAHDLYDEHYDRDGFFSSWNSTLSQGFQTPERFGELELDTDFSRYYWNVGFVSDPQPGDRAVKVRLGNDTGRAFQGKMQLSITRAGEKTSVYQESVKLGAGEKTTVSFQHMVTGPDVESRYELTLRDAGGKLVFLGGTQKKDLTPGDDWPAPEATKKQKKAGLIAFHRPYDQPVLYRAVPQAKEIVSELSVVACRGEFEPTTLEVYPLRDTKSFRVTVSNLTGPGGATIPKSAVTIRRVMPQSDWKNPREFEAREHLLRTFHSLTLVRGRTQRIWITVKIDEKATAGEYRGTVSLNSDGAKSQIALKVRVLPFALSLPDDMGYFMFYPGVAFKPVCNAEFFQKIVKDMRDHGMTTFTIYNWVKVAGGPNGKSYLDLDNRVADNLGVTYARMMEILQKEGMGKNVPLLDVFSQYYEAELIVQLDKICRERKWPEVLFYINDEIEYPERIAAARKVLEAIRAINPEIKTTTAMGPKGAEALGSMYDVWIGCSTPEMVEKCLSMNKKPWSYSCRPVYEVGPAYERYRFGRYAWQLGLKGFGLWSYAEDNVFFDRFGRLYKYGEFTFTPEWKQQLGHVYFENGEIIPAVTWEGVREGIDDYRYILTLKKLAESALANGDKTKQAAGKTGLDLLKAISERTDPTPALNDYGGSEYLRNWKLMGDMDAERARVIEAILNITEKK